MGALPLPGNFLHKAEMPYHGIFGHTIGQIYHIILMSRLFICYTAYILSNQTVAPTLTGFQGIKQCIQYLDSHPHKAIFYPSNSYDESNIIRFTWSGNQVKD